MSVSRQSTAAINAAFSWLLVMTAAWMAVADQPPGLTLLLAGIGGIYLLVPPSNLLPRTLPVLALLLLLMAATAFLPASWTGAAFRQPFLDRGFGLPPTRSPQPWWSFEDLTLLVATFLWAWSCFETKFSIVQRHFLLRCYVFALTVVALNSAIVGTSLWQGLPPSWQELGRFANRNQTGDMLLMGGIISFALGLDQIARRKWAGSWWMIVAVIFFAAMLRNGSRAAVGLFALGLVLLFVLTPRARERGRVIPATLFLAVTVGILIFASLGGEVGARFHDLFTGREGRLAIYRDTCAMVLRTPWLGVGLGNFEGVYNTVRFHTSNLPFRSIHPESDWLWIAAETGVPCLIVSGLLVVVALRTYLGKTPFPDLTRISLTIAILFFLHSLVDVGGHRLGTLWNCLYLVGLGAFRPVSAKDIRLSPFLLRGAGLVLLGVAALRVQSTDVRPWMPTHGSESAVELALLRNPPLPRQKELIDRALGWAPLNWLLYYQRGLVCLQLPDLAHKSLGDFKRALYLEQDSRDLPMAIAEICRHSDLPEAQLAREELLSQSGPRNKALFADLYDPTLDQQDSLGMSTLAEGNPGLETIAVVRQDPSEFDTWRQNLLAKNPSLTGVPPALARALFDRWADVGDAAELIRQWPLHPQWQRAGWRAYATGLAKVGRYADAVATVFRFLPVPEMPKMNSPGSVQDAITQYQANPQDSYCGLQVYFAQLAAGSKQDALATLVQVNKLPERPDYVPYLLAQNLQAAGQHQPAWEALVPLVQKS